MTGLLLSRSSHIIYHSFSSVAFFAVCCFRAKAVNGCSRMEPLSQFQFSMAWFPHTAPSFG